MEFPDMESQDNNWYQTWFDEDYLTLYAHRDDFDAYDQLDLIRRHVNPGCLQSILDLGCGAGRHLEIMRSWGWRAVGLDLSRVLLNEARLREPTMPLIQGDMRNIPGRFDLILSLFTSFGYFEQTEQNLQVFSAVRASLGDAGKFWLDFLNPAYICAHIREKEIIRTANGQDINIRRRLDQGRVIKEIDLGQRRVVESVWLYDADTLCSMASLNKMKVKTIFGDYLGNPYGKHSPRIIMFMETVK